ncbi:hypothetical protein [Undibacterium sp. Xuan67W]|uniref:hypothetical protein n=1 Tax=Undibacterium sp. Xuan67W TaxID=3413057 RepID=UPI003BF345B8
MIALDFKGLKAQFSNQTTNMFVQMITMTPIIYPEREPARFQSASVLAQNQMVAVITALLGYTGTTAISVACVVQIK